MAQILIFGGMLFCAMAPFYILTRLMRAGQTGLAMTVIAIIGAAFAILLYASGRPFGIDPIYAMTIAMLICVPAFLGSVSGMLLGWLLRRRDDASV